MEIALSIVIGVAGLYLLNLIYCLTRFFIQWRMSSRRTTVSFTIASQQGPAADDPFGYLTIRTPFYDEEKKHFTFAFAPVGFSLFFVPLFPVGEVLREEFGDQHLLQVLHDGYRAGTSALPADPEVHSLKGVDLFAPSVVQSDRFVDRAFSPGTDLLFIFPQWPDPELLERFVEESGQMVHHGELVRKGLGGLQPAGMILKEGDKWGIAHRERNVRRMIIDNLFGKIGEKTMRKNSVEGEPSPVDLGDQILGAGERHWTFEVSLDGEKVLFDGNGVRVGDWQEANWIYEFVPIERRA